MHAHSLLVVAAMAGTAAATPKLIIEDDDGKVTTVPVIRDELTFGRVEGNTIRLTQRDVSPRHARLTCKDGTCAIEDLGSDNGTRVNGVFARKPVPLRDGDVVQIGGYRLTLWYGEPKPRPAMPARLVAGATKYALDRDVTTIGSAPDNTIVLKHVSIDAHHARIERTGNRYRITDLGSATGIRVDREDYYSVELGDGDRVEIGKIELRFVAK